MKRVFVLSFIALLAICSIITAAYFHFPNLSVLNPQGVIGLREKGIIVITFAMASIVMIPVFILLFWFAWKYRATNTKTKVEHTPDWDHDNPAAEFLWWLVPTAIIAFLSVIMWTSSHELDPYVPIKSDVPPITVQVVALDWKWLFIYPEQHIATVNELKFPENTPVHFEITADAPMNSFWIPSLGGQIMAMQGMSNQLYLMASTTGVYHGMSANISGKGFSGMEFNAESLSREDFDSWVTRVEQQQKPLTQMTYDELAKPSENVPPTEYSSIQEELYNGIIMKYMMPPHNSQVPIPPTTDSMEGMNM